MGTAILGASPAVCLTLVLGKNLRPLYAAARALQQAHPGRVRLLGWTRRVPRLLNQHHLVIGKAGGATVHEAIAAQCPMLIHHLVPAPEEATRRPRQPTGGGALAATPAALAAALTAMLADHAAGWHAMKHALARHHRNAGAITATRFILEALNSKH
jgi:processive 1,2-diacylglycerol beta-glucosyltransferase